MSREAVACDADQKRPRRPWRRGREAVACDADQKRPRRPWWRGRLSALWLSVLALAGCGGDPQERPAGEVAGAQTVRDSVRSAEGFATAAELRWLRRLASWSAAFSEAGKRVETFEKSERFQRVLARDDEALAAYRELLGPIRACPQSFRNQVGPPPTDCLRTPARNYAEGCGHFRHGVDLLLEALDEQDEELARHARVQIVEAGKQAAVAAGALPPGEKQDLPVVRRAASRSRVDPRYGQAASGLAGKEVEVRCWSPRDWRRLMVEEKVFTRGRVNEQVLAFASAGGMRINVGPLICRHLDALVYGRARPADERRRYDLALALVGLAHEEELSLATAPVSLARVPRRRRARPRPGRRTVPLALTSRGDRRALARA